MTISAHLETFAGLKVVTYDPKSGFRRGRPGKVGYRLGAEPYESEHTVPELLDDYLGRKGAAETTVLVIGNWNYDDRGEWGKGNGEVVGVLVSARERLPKLRSLFLGEATHEECQISDIAQGDVAPLLSAYPQLEEFRVRGVQRLTFGRLHHDNLRVLAVESGGLPAEILKEISAARLPQLEHLELWLGTANYDGIDTTAPLKPLLAGKQFPKLRYLGLRNSYIADTVAQAVASAPVLKGLRVLDLSLGNLGDEGAQALIASAAVRQLEKLDLRHHYVSPEVVAELQGLGIEVDTSEVRTPDTYTVGNETHVERYNSVSE
jgi:hypothetical protein